MATNRTLSSSGCRSSRACSRTLLLNPSHESSRFMYSDGSERLGLRATSVISLPLPSSASRVPSLIPPRATVSSVFAKVLEHRRERGDRRRQDPRPLRREPVLPREHPGRVSPDLLRQVPQTIDRQPVARDLEYRPAPTRRPRRPRAPPMSHAGRSRPACSRNAASSASVGGSWRTKRSVVRLVPSGSETRSSGPLEASPRMSCAEPPPRSTTSTLPSSAHGREGAPKTERGLLLAGDEAHLQARSLPARGPPAPRRSRRRAPRSWRVSPATAPRSWRLCCANSVIASVGQL